MDITFVTSATTDDEGRALLRALGFPFKAPENDPKKAVRFLIDQRARAEWGPDKISDAVCEAVANRLLNEREHSKREGTAIPGAAEYLDILRILVKFKEGKEDEQLAALDTISDFALKKNREGQQ